MGTEINNLAFSGLGAMLDLETQKGKEAMKTSNFQNNLGGTSTFVKRLAIATKYCGQITSYDT